MSRLTEADPFQSRSIVRPATFTARLATTTAAIRLMVLAGTPLWKRPRVEVSRGKTGVGPLLFRNFPNGCFGALLQAGRVLIAQR
jgi:hypothetical protein